MRIIRKVVGILKDMKVDHYLVYGVVWQKLKIHQVVLIILYLHHLLILVEHGNFLLWHKQQQLLSLERRCMILESLCMMHIIRKVEERRQNNTEHIIRKVEHGNFLLWHKQQQLLSLERRCMILESLCMMRIIRKVEHVRKIMLLLWEQMVLDIAICVH